MLWPVINSLRSHYVDGWVGSCAQNSTTTLTSSAGGGTSADRFANWSSSINNSGSVISRNADAASWDITASSNSRHILCVLCGEIKDNGTVDQELRIDLYKDGSSSQFFQLTSRSTTVYSNFSLTAVTGSLLANVTHNIDWRLVTGSRTVMTRGLVASFRCVADTSGLV